ncbi:unnamed protein product [Amoebophrya sp. A25]|nr:unnamed protein product [Amoebophrya sp. A25]|eukprot:GSA25T00001024001.1
MYTTITFYKNDVGGLGVLAENIHLLRAERLIQRTSISKYVRRDMMGMTVAGTTTIRQRQGPSSSRRKGTATQSGTRVFPDKRIKYNQHSWRWRPAEKQAHNFNCFPGLNHVFHHHNNPELE